jgi:hypothetical protein
MGRTGWWIGSWVVRMDSWVVWKGSGVVSTPAAGPTSLGRCKTPWEGYSVRVILVEVMGAHASCRKLALLRWRFPAEVWRPRLHLRWALRLEIVSGAWAAGRREGCRCRRRRRGC